MTRDQLLDLLTTAATIGRNEAFNAGTRGEIKEYIERRMQSQIAAALAGTRDREHGPEAQLECARGLLTEAEQLFEAATLSAVSARVKQVYPTATALRYDSQENEDCLLHAYVRAILDADGTVLDSMEDPSDDWDELIDGKIEPLLSAVSERDQSYYGEGKTLELD